MISPVAFSAAPASAIEAVEPVSTARLGSLKFARFGWCVLGYCIAAVVWGSFVRASGSGDGCGMNWPTCGGEGVIPLWSSSWEKVVEASHRLTSGLTLPLIMALVVGAHRVFPKSQFRRHPAR